MGMLGQRLLANNEGQWRWPLDLNFFLPLIVTKANKNVKLIVY
jgi:hypothetical protein